MPRTPFDQIQHQGTMAGGVSFGQIHHDKWEKLDPFPQIIWFCIYFSLCLASIPPASTIVSWSGARAPPLVLLTHKIPRYIFLIITEGHYYNVEMRLNYQG